jgi:hypothetical protein
MKVHSERIVVMVIPSLATLVDAQSAPRAEEAGAIRRYLCCFLHHRLQPQSDPVLRCTERKHYPIRPGGAEYISGGLGEGYGFFEIDLVWNPDDFCWGSDSIQ